MGFDPYEFDHSYAPARQNSLSRYTAKTFWWMFIGLAITFMLAMFLERSGYVWYLFAMPFVPIILLVSELAVVLILSARIHKLSIPMARGMFFLYSALTGVTFAVYFVVYELSSLILVFGATSLYFGVVAAYGYVTKADLSRLRNVLVTGLICLLVFAVLSLFIPFLTAFDRIICLAGIALFMGFTAYDTQKIKRYYYAYQQDQNMLEKCSVIAALQLYLDFINIFIYLLRFMGRRKD